MGNKKQRRYAILIGWGEYDHLPHLRAPLNDVAGIAAMVKDPAVGHFTDVVRFDHGEESQAVLASIEKIVTSDAGRDDFILIYFSGHGKLDASGQLYLALKGTKDTVLDTTSIDVARIGKYIQRGRVQSVVFILDCCYSGAVKQAIAKGAIIDSLNKGAAGTGLVILTSSTEFQESFEGPGEKYSLFTKMLFDGTVEGYADADYHGEITVDDAFNYAYEAVRLSGKQTPTRTSYDVRGNLILAHNRRSQRPDIAQVSQELIPAYAAVSQMVTEVRYADDFLCFVALTGYWIEGYPYRATGLQVSKDHTANLRQTQDGFECDTWFEPHMIQDATVKGKDILTRTFDDRGTVQLVKVRLTVNLKDIWNISAKKGQTQIELFQDAGVLQKLGEFAQMAEDFYRKKKRGKKK